MRSEHLTDKDIIAKNYPEYSNKNYPVGPIIMDRYNKLYFDASEKHVEVVGSTGMGKTQAVVLPLTKMSCDRKESFIIADSKSGEIYKKTAKYTKNHNLKCINFCELEYSNDCWNPLKSIAELYKTGNIVNKKIACEMLHNLSESINSPDPKDPFWPNASAELFEGITLALIELAGSDSEINISSICKMMEVLPRKFTFKNYAEELVNVLPEDSVARKHLQTYSNAPNDTRGSIHSVASNSLRIFYQNELLTKVLSKDTIDINSLDIDEKPLAFYIILPDDTDAYSALAAVLINQITSHFIRLADVKYDGRLPHRLHIILEELSTVSKSISNLPMLMAKSRSRNIRMYLFIQSLSQITDVYGPNKTDAINDCIGLTYCFSVNNWDTLVEWERKCGEKIVKHGSQTSREPLVTAAEIHNMPCMMALVMTDKYKFFQKFRYFEEAFDLSDWEPPKKIYNPVCDTVIKTFDLESYIINPKRSRTVNSVSIRKENIDDEEKWAEEDLDIPIEKPKDEFRRYLVVEDLNGCSADKAIKIIKKYTYLSPKEIYEGLQNLPFKIEFFEVSKLFSCFKELADIRCKLSISRR